MIEPKRWKSEQLIADAARAIEVFRKERLQEPLDDYLEAFERYQAQIEDLFETTVDLTGLDGSALAVLSNSELLHAFRYLAGPPISEDDLKVIAQTDSMVAKRLASDADAVVRIVDMIRTGLDRRRFPWVAENREPDEAEKSAAILASAALMATQRVGTERRKLGKTLLEGATDAALSSHGLNRVPTRHIRTFADAPAPGEFCGETKLGTRKADFVVRLWDQRILALECKASNSSTNSVKRLNNDAAAKAEVWRRDFGETQVVCAAVLSGVFKVHNLEDAQRRGLSLFWGHDLKALLDWIDSIHH